MELNRVNLRKAYDKAIAFFRENPEKWTKGMMDTHDGCMCLAGRMAFELGYDPEKDHDRFIDTGWTISDQVRLHTGRSVVGLNDSSLYVNDMITRAHSAIGILL